MNQNHNFVVLTEINVSKYFYTARHFMVYKGKFDNSRFSLGFRLGCPMTFRSRIPHSLKYCSILVWFPQIKFKSLSLKFEEDPISGC